MAFEDFGYRLTLATSEALLNSIGKSFSDYFGRFRTAIAENPSEIIQTNTRIASAMRVAVLDAYENNVEARKRYASYRQGENRLSGGVLLRVLSSGSMVNASPDGIHFIDQAVLDSAARHWRRLNFGAGQAASYHDRSYPVVFGDANVGAVTMGGSPSAGFGLPPGVWVPGGKKVPIRLRESAPGFYPLRKEPKTPTVGIEARQFLDAGLETFAKEFGPTYVRMFDRIFARAIIESAEYAEAEVSGPPPPPAYTPKPHVEESAKTVSVRGYARTIHKGTPEERTINVRGYRRRPPSRRVAGN